MATPAPAPSQSVAAEPLLRGRGGFRSSELNTIPEGVTETRAPPDCGKPVNILANFIAINPMSDRAIQKYRVDFEPNIESVSLRRRMFLTTIQGHMPKETTSFDGMSDARSTKKAEQDPIEALIPHPEDPTNKKPFTVKVKHVGEVLWGSGEMLRVYNINMKRFFRQMNFFEAPGAQRGAFLHSDLQDKIDGNDDLRMIRGFRTATNIHMNGRILMNLEAVHKLLQNKNVLQLMTECRRMGGNIHENIRALLVGKRVIVNYKNRICYRIEDVNFQTNPMRTFLDNSSGREITFVEYYRNKYNINVRDANQPLLLVTQSNKNRQAEREGEAEKETYLIPELCNIAGLTPSQENDPRLRTNLIRSSQIAPQERVNQMDSFLAKLHSNREIAESLASWGYSLGKTALKIKGHVLPTESIGVGAIANGPTEKWPTVDNSGGFEQHIMRSKLAQTPEFPKLAIIVQQSVVRANQKDGIIGKLREGLTGIGLLPNQVERIEALGDSPQIITQCLRTLPPDVTAAIIIIRNQNKELYDAIKKFATTERGLITQVVTARLMTDDRKSRGAATKIGIQLAAKIGGEPWYINLKFSGTMICGYDTHDDTTQRGRSFGAFVASVNHKFSRWFSKADPHDSLEELSTQLAENFGLALKEYHSINEKYPERVFFYRDGVDDGKLEHVYHVELEQTKKVIKDLNVPIKLTVIIVNKRIGARFYLHQGQSERGPAFVNPNPGTVIDDYVTRKERYDFYLISQSTRHGTVSPTYYNIIHDESGIPPAKHQMMAYKLCLAYYNWAGTVRVPAPCQYAHKLAYLCGEHLHRQPNSHLNDRLHFL